MRISPDSARRDDGFTLIELIIYSALLLLVMGLTGSILINGMTNQARITETAVATSEAQVAAESIGNGVRNAQAISSPTAASPFLVVLTVGRGENATPSCQAWYYSAAARELRTTTTSPGTRIAVPSSSQFATWTLLAEDVDPVSGTLMLNTAGRTVNVAYAVEPDQGATQVIQTSFTSRQPAGTGDLGQCVL